MSQHVELAYACTDMGGQGRTVQGGLLFADRPTDIRNLYVAMTRGSETNQAFFGVTGEETAVDVFVQCMTTDWIDQPATVRHAELNETTPHRPGLLDAPTLRMLMEERHEILTMLEDAGSLVRSAPTHQHMFEREVAEAYKTIARADAEYRRAEAVIETYDRPLRRKKHEYKIHMARREIHRQPEVIRRAHATMASAENKLTNVAERTAEARQLLRRWSDLESKVADIDDRLAHDLRVRARVVRLEQPTAIVDTIGPRLQRDSEASAWDQAAARLHQHQAAFAIPTGIGGWPGHLDRSVYGESQSLVEQTISKLCPERPAVQVAAPEIDLPGIEL